MYAVWSGWRWDDMALQDLTSLTADALVMGDRVKSSDMYMIRARSVGGGAGTTPMRGGSSVRIRSGARVAGRICMAMPAERRRCSRIHRDLCLRP